MRKAVIVVLTVLGALLLLYPVVAIFVGNVRIGEISRMQAQEMKQVSVHPDQAQKLLKQAHEYNANIRGIPILDPYLYKMTKTGSEEYQEYLGTLPGDVMAGWWCRQQGLIYRYVTVPRMTRLLGARGTCLVPGCRLAVKGLTRSLLLTQG